MSKIKVAVVGVGNCASSLIQGIEYYRRGLPGRRDRSLGLMHYRVGPYLPGDIEVVAAVDIDARKVGQPLGRAIFAPPNCTKTFLRPVRSAVKVRMGRVLDGVSPHMEQYPQERRFVVADRKPVDVAGLLKRSGAEICLNYLPVGSEQATRFYAQACLKAGVSFLNCMPVFIVSDPDWAARFARAGIPVIGDDIKAQIGATIVHRTLVRLFEDRGVKLDATYQLNIGGNTDFLNMLSKDRLVNKRISKTDAVQSELAHALPADRIHIGPSDYVAWQLDNKICFLRMEGRGFAGIPMHLELRLSVEDSPNSAGVAIDAIRCLKLARDRGLAGPLEAPSAWFMKHPPRQMTDREARAQVDAFINDAKKPRRRKRSGQPE